MRRREPPVLSGRLILLLVVIFAISAFLFPSLLFGAIQLIWST